MFEKVPFPAEIQEMVRKHLAAHCPREMEEMRREGTLEQWIREYAETVEERMSDRVQDRIMWIQRSALDVQAADDARRQGVNQAVLEVMEEALSQEALSAEVS